MRIHSYESSFSWRAKEFSVIKNLPHGIFKVNMLAPKFGSETPMLILSILIFALLLFFFLALTAYKRFSIGWSFKKLFKDFNRKMWMTVSLGALFFGLYLFTVYLLRTFIIPQWGSELLFLAHQNPTAFIYGGLWLFAFFSLAIYLARMVIKYLYISHGKDS